MTLFSLLDDVLWANVEPSTPDWSNQIDED